MSNMSRITRSVSNLMRLSFNGRLYTNKVQTTGKSLNQLRSLSTVVTTGFNSRHLKNERQPTVMSKRFAANSPQVDEELTQFLTSEIELEKQTQKKSLPSIPGWKISGDGSNVVFEKTLGSEQITVRTNVNHSVDQKNFGEDVTEEAAVEMICRPEFAVEIKRGNLTLGLNCAFVDAEDMAEEQSANPDLKEEERQVLEDEFQINEFSLFDGEFKENSYAVSGEVMDGSMYDLMMDLLHERGIDQQFARSLIEYTTVYEHTQYVGLLVKLKDFFSKK